MIVAIRRLYSACQVLGKGKLVVGGGNKRGKWRCQIKAEPRDAMYYQARAESLPGSQYVRTHTSNLSTDMNNLPSRIKRYSNKIKINK